jgi:hypothetical protein
VSNSINFQLVATVADIPTAPDDDTYIEIQNSTGIESFSPLSGLPSGFVGDSGLTVRFRYTSAGTTWNWLNYYANNSEVRYLKLSGGTMTGKINLDSDPTSNLHPASKQYVDAADTLLQGHITTAQNTADGAVSTANAALPKAGGTMTGDITFNGTQTFPGTVTSVSGTSPINVTGTTTPTVSVDAASTSSAGVVQLSDSTSLTSSTVAATSTAVKAAYDLAGTANTTANAALPKAGGTMTGDITFNSSQAYPKVPQNAQTSGYTLVAGDAGKHVSITTGGVTIPASVFAAGDIISIFNNSTTTQTITQGGSVTLRQAGTTNTGNRTLDGYGIATVLCVGTNTFVISGPGVA